MKKGTKAQLFTLDLLLALIPLTIALGMSANAISGVATQMEDYAHWYSYHRLVNDAMDVLIKTPGEPPDWNSTNSPSILGLANYTNTSGVGPYYLDDMKVGALNASIGGGYLYQVGLSQLLGNESFPYLKLSFLGATVNTTTFSIIFTNGSRADASNIYAVERLALLEVEKIVGIMEEVGHFESNATPCCETGGQRRYNVSFYIPTDDLTNYDYWLVEDITGTAPGSYGVNPTDGVTCDCTGGVLPHSLPNSGFYQEHLPFETYLTGDATNEVIIRLEGNGYANIYIIRAPIGTSSGLISPEMTGAKPVKVILEVGR